MHCTSCCPPTPCKAPRSRWGELYLRLQAKKAERKPVSVHVAVVELRHDASAGQDAVQYLLVRRPAAGLLAGMPSLQAVLWQGEASTGEDLQDSGMGKPNMHGDRPCGLHSLWH